MAAVDMALAYSRKENTHANAPMVGLASIVAYALKWIAMTSSTMIKVRQGSVFISDSEK